jgi:hypothetical protein
MTTSSIQLLNPNEFPKGIQCFIGTDSKKLFIDNFKTQPADWEWKTRSITYNNNSQGYRCAEFDQIDWDSSILLFGCSMAYGIGMDYERTIGQQLSRLLAAPVVNLARTGTSYTFNWINSIQLCAAGVRPRAVVYIWPDSYRSSRFYSEDPLQVQHRGVWNYDGKELADQGYPLHHQHMAHYQSLSLQHMWSCPVTQWTWVTEEQMPLVKQLPQCAQGHARDLMHPGAETLTTYAETIAEDLAPLLALSRT